MPPKTQTLKIKRIINTTPDEAFDAFTSALDLRAWFCDAAEVDARDGGRLYVWWNTGYYAAGQIFAFAPGKKLAFTWRGRGEPDSTQVQITFRARKDGTTIVTVAHSGIWSGRKWAAAVGEFEKGWYIALQNLQSTLETGQDLRFVRRPMLGIFLGDFNAAEAAKLNVPVKKGVRLDGVVEGLSAAAAGLQKGDVIVSIGSSKVTGIEALGSVLQTHQAGDQVKVTYYRGPEKMTVNMPLTPRPLPDIPATPAELSAALRQTYAEAQAARAECFAGATDAEANAKPAPSEWSAKETLAHLLTGERDVQHWITGLMTGQETVEFLENVDARYSAVASVYTLPEMLTAMQQAEAETVALVAALPPKFAGHKARYWRLAYNLLQPDAHTLDHLEQIKAALAAARGA